MPAKKSAFSAIVNLDENWSPFVAYGAKKRHKFLSAADLSTIGILLFCIICIVFKASSLAQYNWNWKLLAEFIIRYDYSGHLAPGLLLTGLFTTIRVGTWSILFALLIGMGPGIYFAKKSGFAIFPHFIMVNIIRNTPPLVLLFCIYFFAGNLFSFTPMEDAYRALSPEWRNFVTAVYAPPGQLDRMTAAILALGIYQAAYMAEIFRSGTESVDNGQMDAALALGFSRFACMRLVVLPQAARLILPPLTGQAITAFKDSALASLISLPDLTFQSLEIMAVSNMTFEVWTSCGILYLLLGTACAALGEFFEKKYAFKNA